MSKFAPIHIISGYSFLRSGLTLKKIESALKDNDYFGMGLTDEGVLHGFPPFFHLMKKYKKPYILGLSLQVDENELVAYAIDEEGYANLINISLAIQKEEFNFDYLKEHSSGLLGVLETNHGKFKELFSQLEKIDTSFTKYVLEVSEVFKAGFYLGVEVTSKEEVKYANKVRRFANEYTYECVAFPRVKYLKKEDAIILDIVEAISSGEQIKEKTKVGQEYFMTDENYHKIYSGVEIDNTNKIIQSNKLDFSKSRGQMLHYPCDNSDEELTRRGYESLESHGLKDNKQYVERLEYELGVIKSMGYSDYFLLVQDYVGWAKNNGILVGPGRGSAAGALISYLLNITEIDPLKYGLQFERFLNPNRSTMPDIDVDFMDTRRDEVVQYMRDKYGNNRVGNIVALQTIGAKQSLRDIGRVYGISETYISLLSKTIKKDKEDKEITLGKTYRTSETFKKLCDTDQYLREIVSLAGKIEGLPRQAGQHAAGIVVNNVNMALAMPVSIDLNDNYISQYEFEYLEEQGFLKMDFLGLRNLTTVSYCVDLINLHHPELHLDKYNIPFDTPEVFELIREGQVIGLFQIETPVMKKGIKTIKPTCFEDVVALLALNRPGPMAFIPSYAKRRDGKEAIQYISKDLEDILSSTYGIIVYQEQINQIATKIAGMTPGESDLFRRAISKKDKAALTKNKELFIKGCLAKGYNQKTADNIFEHIAKFANYGFNKSHSVAYAVLTCRMAWLKANYPLEFYSAILQTGSTSETKFGEYISEMKKRGIEVLPPSVNHSSMYFDVKEKALLFPFSAIHGLNSLMAKNIIEEREKGPFTDFFNFVTRLYPYKINEAQILALVNAGALDEFYPSRASMRITIKAALQFAELNYSEDGQMNLGISALETPLMNEDVDRPIDNLDFEYDAIGVMLSSNPLDYQKDKLDKLGVKQIAQLETGKTTKIACVIKNSKQFKTKKNEQMAVLKVYDQTGDLDVTIFPRVYDTVKGYITRNSIVIITGHLDNREEQSFLADTIEKLEVGENA